jgi:hypothetical protein
MSQISQALEKGFLKYYNTVIKTGTVSKKSIDNLIVASWINDVLEGKYDCSITEEQYSLLNILYTCVEGSCLTPYNNCEKSGTSNTPVMTIYYGSGNSYEDFYENKKKYNTILQSPVGSYTITVRHAMDCVYFLIPRSMNINEAFLGGFPFPLEHPMNVVVDSTEYKYYKSSNTYDAETLTIIIS